MEDNWMHQYLRLISAPCRSRCITPLSINNKIAVQNLDAARSDLLSLVKHARTQDDLERCLNLIGILFGESATRRELVKRLLLRLTSRKFLGVASPEQKRLRLRLKLALEDYNDFLTEFRSDPSFAETNKDLAYIAQKIQKPCAEVIKEPKIFCIGLSRTGTSSLTAALEILGFSAAHWNNPLTLQLVSWSDYFLFDAVLDITVCDVFETLYFRYPNSKFIYTERDMESWIKSLSRHYQRFHGASRIEDVRQLFGGEALRNAAVRSSLVQFSLYFNYPTFSDARRAYEERVETFFKAQNPSRLLKMNTFDGDGWEKLCAFLGKPIPIEPYPWVNRGLV